MLMLVMMNMQEMQEQQQNPEHTTLDIENNNTLNRELENLIHPTDDNDDHVSFNCLSLIYRNILV